MTDAPVASSPAQESHRYTARVLVVEDNPVNQILAQELLASFGCTVALADDGQQGVQAWEAGAFDLICMDVQMPVMDGLAASRAIRAAEGDGQRIAIIAVTAFADRESRQRCEEAGMDDFLAKPYTRADLADVLARYLEPLRAAS